MLLSVKNLTCSRNNHSILGNISLTLNKAQIISLYGPNGSGKTTLLKTLANILSYSEGIITKKTKEICFLGNTKCLKTNLTVKENLSFWNGIYAGDTLEKAISSLKLQDIINIPIAQLSAGQKRKVALARLVISKSEVWLLDEPYSALDKENLLLFNQAIVGHLKTNGGIIMSSHTPIEFEGAKPLNILEFKIANGLQNDPFIEGSCS
jgi:heme exporter protein A